MTKKYGKNSFQKSWKTILSHHEQQNSANQEEKTGPLIPAELREPEETPEASSASSALTEAETESMTGLESSLAQTDESQRDPAPEMVENPPVVPELKPDYGTSSYGGHPD